MEPQDADATDELSSATESEYGGGTELSASGFLVLGLISYWTYTVWKYHQLLCAHLAARRVHFSERLDADKLAPEDRRVHDVLVSKGFTCPTAPRFWRWHAPRPCPVRTRRKKMIRRFAACRVKLWILRTNRPPAPWSS